MLSAVVFYWVLAVCLAHDIPSFLPRCSMNDPNKVGDCILTAAMELKPRIRNGINEIGIPSYDPLVIPQIKMQHESDMVNYTATVWNYTIRGLDNYDFTEIQYDPNTETFHGKLEFDPISINSLYIFNGSLLFIPVRGNGSVEASLGPINGTFKITGNLFKRKSVDYYDVTDVKVRLAIDDSSLHFDGLFERKEQAAMTNELLNRNSKMIAKAVTPLIERISEKFIMRYVKWLTKTFSYYKLFPHS